MTLFSCFTSNPYLGKGLKDANQYCGLVIWYGGGNMDDSFCEVCADDGFGEGGVDDVFGWKIRGFGSLN